MKHRDNGTHAVGHEAKNLAAMYWAEQKAARRAARQTVWATDRPIPLGVLDTWPVAVTA